MELMKIQFFEILYGYANLFAISWKPSRCRRGEEHSFILKPAISALKKSKIPDDKLTKLHSRAGSKPASFRLPPVAVEETKNISTPHKYAILISCRCNYSGNP